nr:hypothetical protein Q903MT_gene4762 [Picea sitchensis]
MMLLKWLRSFPRDCEVTWTAEEYHFRQRYKVPWTFLENTLEKDGFQVAVQFSVSSTNRRTD